MRYTAATCDPNNFKVNNLNELTFRNMSTPADYCHSWLAQSRGVAISCVALGTYPCEINWLVLWSICGPKDRRLCSSPSLVWTSTKDRTIHCYDDVQCASSLWQWKGVLSHVLPNGFAGGRRTLCAHHVWCYEKCVIPLHSGPIQNLGQGRLEESRCVHRLRWSSEGKR